MIPFNSEIALVGCPKCNMTNPSMQYIKPGYDPDGKPLAQDTARGEVREHLLLTCRRCLYTWTMKCADARDRDVPSDTGAAAPADPLGEVPIV